MLIKENGYEIPQISLSYVLVSVFSLGRTQTAIGFELLEQTNVKQKIVQVQHKLIRRC